MSYNVENLPKFTDESSRDFVLKTIFGAQTVDFLEKSGSYHPNAHVGASKIQLLDTDVVWQNGASCSIAEMGSAKFEQADLVVKQIVQKMALCNADLEETFASADLNAKRAGLSLDNALFLDYIVDDISLKNAEKLEQLVWNGDITKTTNDTLKWFDGYLKQLLTGTYDLSAVTGANIVEKLQNAFLAMPASITRQKDFTIFISATNYSAYKIAIQRANLFDAGQPNILVGTTATLTVVDGLEDSKKAVFGRARNFRIGGNLNDMGIKNFYNEDEEKVKITMRLSAGVTAIYKQEIGVLDLA